VTSLLVKLLVSFDLFDRPSDVVQWSSVFVFARAFVLLEHVFDPLLQVLKDLHGLDPSGCERLAEVHQIATLERLTELASPSFDCIDVAGWRVELIEAHVDLEFAVWSDSETAENSAVTLQCERT
jgi:hypothetical protein